MMNGENDTVHVVDSLIGLFGVTAEGEIVERVLYPPDPKRIAAALERQMNGEVTKELSSLMEKLVQRGFKTFVFSSQAMANGVGSSFEVNTVVEVRSEAGDAIRRRLNDLAVESGFVKDSSSYLSINHEVSMLRASEAVRRAQSDRGTVITQTVQTLNELDKALNALSGKLREWYGLHFPELNRYVSSHETYAQIVQKFGDRANIEVDPLSELGFSRGKASGIVQSAGKSMGAPLEAEDLVQLQFLASHLLSLYSYRGELEAHVSKVAVEVAPNLSEVAGPVLAAKLIERAGSIRKLAMMPSSTMQILGAEKALFRAKKTGARPPKHGLIFQHPFVHSKPRKQRGRSSRVLSSKLVLAARADAFTGNPIGAELKRQLSEEK
ncbi:MAG TPA: C/D box methylation guide ribonucleoprotein complex aNOP56 subunit [Patescibacteria group bacterium]|nr:C/D box methylation guide ribonucleoprotein complex aNOP56 subunit [Patescibacteria group bacterium]